MDDRPMRNLTIREVSDRSGLTAHTLRYYERIGLMIPVERTAGGHRQYTEAAIGWVTLLRHLRATGMSIADMGRFAELVRVGPESVPDRLELLRGHRDAVTRQIATLSSALRALDDKIAHYCRGRGGDAAYPGPTGRTIRMTASLTPFPRVALGTMYYGTRIDAPSAFRMIDMFVDAGETMLDTANNYAFWPAGSQGGESESLIGRWLAASGRRDKVIIATKIGARPTMAGGTLKDAEGLGTATVRSAVESSLSRLGVATLDLCYAHIDDRDVPLEETLGAFHDLVAEGKIRQIAASNLRAERLVEALAISQRHGWPAYEALQQRHSVIAQVHGSAFGDHIHGSDFGVQEATTPAVFEAVRTNGLHLVAYSPLLEGAFGAIGAPDRPLPNEYDSEENRGRVADVYRIAGEMGVSAGRLVLAVLIAQNVTPLLGARTPAQLDDSLAARELRVMPDVVATLSVHPALPAGG